jgi:branched-chain amino acid transport system substrate-binding protein
VKEYSSRQSPMILFGNIQSVSESEDWELTEGACEYITINMYPPKGNYPLTSKTIPFRDAYLSRWNTTEVGSGAFYDAVRYILPDAIERAGTIETDAVIEALEATSIETSLARNFKFTSDHDILVGENPDDPDNDHYIAIYFQWQDGNLIPVYPKKIMEEARATFMFPDWPGPWD